MSLHQAYELYVFDRRLLGVQFITPDNLRRLLGATVGPPDSRDRELVTVKERAKWFQGSSRSGWFVEVARRLIPMSGIECLTFLYDDEPGRSFRETLNDSVGNEVWSNAVWYTFIDGPDCSAVAGALANLITWCYENPSNAASCIDCDECEIRENIGRAHTIVSSGDVHADEGQGVHYFFCVLTTLRDLLSRAFSSRWVGLYKVYSIE